MKRFGVSHISIMVVIALIIIFFACQTQQQSQMTGQTPVERGEYLVTLGGCNHCHTPKVFSEHGMALDTTRLLSGYPHDLTLPEIDLGLVAPGKWILFNQDLTAAAGPWGVSFSANLTPDENTGIGLWTEELFIETFRTGKHLGKGRPILPPMPWEDIGLSTDEDLKSMFAYLKSLKPIQNQVPQPIPMKELMAK